MSEWSFDEPRNVAVFTTISIIREQGWIASVWHDDDDGSWQFHDNIPGTARLEDAMVVALEGIVALDGTITQLADLPEGWRAWRDGPNAPWQRAPVR